MRLERAEIVLPVRGRFDLRATVLSHGYHQLPPYGWRDGPRPVLERAEQLRNGSVHLLRIWPAPDGVLLQVTGRNARQIEVLAPLVARVRRALDLDLNLPRFHRACRRDPLLRPVAQLGLGRLLRGTSVFEDVVKVVLWSSTTWAGAVCAATRLATLGRRCPALPALRAFPDPRRLARLGTARLCARTGLGEPAAWIRALARDVAAGRLNLAGLERAPAPACADVLARIPGLGPVGIAWLILLLGHHDEPVLDPVTRGFARRALGDDGRRLERWLSRQRPWRGLALWFAHWAGAPAAAPLRTRRPPASPDRRGARS